MKGIFISQKIEYRLEINGEAWKQGDPLQGTLFVKNLSEKPLQTQAIGCFLTHANSRKLKSKDAASFTVLESSLLDPKQELAPGVEKKLTFIFQLSLNCPISENSSSLYIACGRRDQLMEGGYLRLCVTPFSVITEFLDIFCNFLKFKVKTLKSKKEFVEVSLQPPNSKEFTAVGQLKLLIRMCADNLELKYKFKLKKLDYSSPINEVREERLNIERTLSPKQYQIYGSAINQDGILKHLDEVLGHVRVNSFV